MAIAADVERMIAATVERFRRLIQSTFPSIKKGGWRDDSPSSRQ